MSVVDNLSSLYNVATIVLVGAATLTSPHAHAKTLEHATGMHMGIGNLTIIDSNMSHVYQVSDNFTVKSSIIDDLKVIGNAYFHRAEIGEGSFVGSVNAGSSTVFHHDVNLTTALSTFSDSYIYGNLNVDHHGDIKTSPQISLSNTNITGDIVCKDHCYVHSFNSSFNELKNGTLN